MQPFSSKEASFFPLNQTGQSYSTGMHIDFSRVVHRINVPLHEHSQQDLAHSDFQPSLSLGLIK